jgi:hypothetical protein
MLARAHGLQLPLPEQRELFELWLDRWRSGRAARQAAFPKRMAELCEESRDLAESGRYLPKRQRAKANAQLAAAHNEM